MQREKVFNKKTIHAYIIVIAIAVILAIVGLIMLRYSVEGERNLPFEIKSILIVSTVEGGAVERDDYEQWFIELFQINDIFFEITKNANHRREDTIRSVVFENIRIEAYNDIGTAKMYRQYNNYGGYQYTEEFLLTDRIEFEGNTSTDIGALQINNQGGVLIGFRVALKDIGRYPVTEDEIFRANGAALNSAGINLDDITMTLLFDIIIETGSGHRTRAEYSIELPAGNILEEEEGRLHTRITDLSNMVFRRF
ncbi:MAG: hypothetical protein FWC79_07780 [Oscillospiraceae bacterium]|nr:hypothetical protein [Oscillospiraceae bacterium]